MPRCCVVCTESEAPPVPASQPSAAAAAAVISHQPTSKSLSAGRDGDDKVAGNEEGEKVTMSASKPKSKPKESPSKPKIKKVIMLCCCRTIGANKWLASF